MSRYSSCFFLIVLLTCPLNLWAISPSSFLSEVNRNHLKSVFTNSLSKDDLSSIFYSALGLEALGSVPANSNDICNKIQTQMEGSLVNIYQASMAGKVLKCTGLKTSATASKIVDKALKGSDTSVTDLFYAASAEYSLGKKLNGANLISSLKSSLMKEDGIVGLGYAFNLATIIDGDVKFVFDRIEDAIVQADEVDSKMLQFEGGISVTDNVVSGAYNLGNKVGKAPPISKTQAVKFANYFLNRKSVQTAKGGYHLINAMNTLTKNKYHVPVAITLSEESSVVSETSPKVIVRITDLLGGSLGKMDVLIESTMRQSDGAVILSNTKMTPIAGDDTSYEIDMMKAKPGRGFYELTITATPVKADARLVGNTASVQIVKSLGVVKVIDSTIGVVEADLSTAPKLNAVSHPQKYGKVLEADHHHKIIFKFTLQAKTSSEKILAHQAFVRFYDAKSGSEIIFVAEADSNSVYKFDLDVSSKVNEFAGRSGKYEIHLLVGDAVISNPIAWHVADINLKFPEDENKSKVSSNKEKLLPEIKHMFREPEKRPPTFVSNVFTLLVLAPILIMVIGWLKIGINITGFPFSLSALGFHVGLGGIFYLYYYFWLQLDMFTTIKYLIMVGVVTFLCGNSLLVRIAENRKIQKS